MRKAREFVKRLGAGNGEGGEEGKKMDPTGSALEGDDEADEEDKGKEEGVGLEQEQEGGAEDIRGSEAGDPDDQVWSSLKLTESL